jgi:hypothetical protein
MSNPHFDFQNHYLSFFVSFIGWKLLRLIGSIISFMTVSFINGLAIRVAIMTSNVAIFPLMWVLKTIMGQNMTYGQRSAVYHSMGAIGAQSAYHERMGQSKLLLLTSLCFTLFLVCFMQTSCYYLWTQMMFPFTYPNSLNDFYFGYMNLVEFSCFLFVRTRTSLKYLPKFVTMLNLMFLFYINSYIYSSSMQFFYLLVSSTVFTFTYFLLEFEHPAINEWNPFDTHTPRMQNPRMAYQLVLDDSSFATGFSIWHMFMPTRGRDAFTLYE